LRFAKIFLLANARKEFFTEGNSEGFRKQAKKTKAGVGICNPSLSSLPSVEFEFLAEPEKELLQKIAKETKILQHSGLQKSLRYLRCLLFASFGNLNSVAAEPLCEGSSETTCGTRKAVATERMRQRVLF
jgi:hypothetical protein